MQRSNLNLITRRGFLDRSFKTGLAVALSTLTDIPFVMKRALAEGSIGLNGKKLLFIWLRGANDALNSVIPVMDSAYAPNRPTIRIPLDGQTNYSTPGGCDFPINAASGDDTYSYASAIRLGNGFAAFHPSLKFLAPVYNAGELALIHRVGYPRQSRSHFDSQNYWENGSPNNNLSKDGIFYRTMLEYLRGQGAAASALTGVSIQSSLPLILRGSEAPMTNLTDPNRYALLGIPNNTNGVIKATAALDTANGIAFPGKRNRDLLQLQYENLNKTLDIFAGIDFDENPVGNQYGNYYRDDEVTDNDSQWASGTPSQNPNDPNRGYYLFPTTAVKNGGWQRPGPNGAQVFDKYAVPTNLHSFFQNLKAAALVLNKTDAIIAGTEYGGFDTHSNQGGVTGAHSNLNRGIGWAMYALRKYFTLYADKATWENVVVVTLTEFGRTTVENSDAGTDHAEAGVMFVAGGGVKGYGRGPTGVFNCGPDTPSQALVDPIPWIPGGADQGGGVDGAMFGVNNRYLRRTTDYRSVLGEIIRKHLGATQGQLQRIIPGYANPADALMNGGLSTDSTPIRGEVGIL